MNFLNTFMNVFLSIPFLAELILFMILSVPWVLFKEKSGKPLTGPPSQGLVRLLAITVFIVGGLKVGVSAVFGQGFPVLMLIVYASIAVVLLAMSRLQMKFQVFAALCVGCVLFVTAQAMFTGIHITRTYSARWEIKRPDAVSQMTDAPDYIQFIYDDAPQYFDYIYSDKISTFLMIQKKPQVDLEVRLMYQWGLLVGHSIEKVNGMTWQRSEQEGTGVSGNAPGAGPFPTFYFGLSDPAPGPSANPHR